MSYEPGTFNLINPTKLERGKGEIDFQHRFIGKINEEPIDNFFGLDSGASIGADIRYIALPGLEIDISRIWRNKEYSIGIGYSYSIPKTPVITRLDAEFFSYEEFILEKSDFERKNGGAGSLSLMSESFYRITPLLNLCYNFHTEKLGLGIGVTVKLLENMGILQKLNAIAEYYPTTIDDEHKNCLAMGMRVETYSHHFDFIFSNNSQLGVRNLMAGTNERDGWRFGFNIKRLI